MPPGGYPYQRMHAFKVALAYCVVSRSMQLSKSVVNKPDSSLMHAENMETRLAYVTIDCILTRVAGRIGKQDCKVLLATFKCGILLYKTSLLA